MQDVTMNYLVLLEGIYPSLRFHSLESAKEHTKGLPMPYKIVEIPQVPDTSWCYEPYYDEKTDVWSIVETYGSDITQGQPAMTDPEISPSGDTLEELINVLEMMLKDCKRFKKHINGTEL